MEKHRNYYALAETTFDCHHWTTKCFDSEHFWLHVMLYPQPAKYCHWYI